MTKLKEGTENLFTEFFYGTLGDSIIFLHEDSQGKQEIVDQL
jgi:hypothetical protein